MTTEQLENDARLRGLLAVANLPPLRGADGKDRRRVVEIEIEAMGAMGTIAFCEWMPIHGANRIENNLIEVWFGTNGSRWSRTFDAERCPRWRSPRIDEHTYLVESHV